ncbi:MAG: isochorismatase family protein [Chloroflexi bacterium]|nr:isochorismatase family protein [Chloroflexota bacterium]
MATKRHAWEDLLTSRDKKFMEGTTFGARRGLGVRPCLLVIDMQYMASGDKDEDILEMKRKWPGGCGHEAWEGIRNQQKLLPAARAAGVPIIYTRYIPQLIRFDGFAKKNARPAQQPNPNDKGWQIVEEIKPQPNEIVLDKSYASVLFGTPLISWLTAMQVDTTLLVGNSTGGCVRASAVDLTTHNFNVAVIEDCLFDRIQLAHAAALFDMWMKYCDVMWLDEVLEYLKTVKDGEVVRQPAATRL